MTKIKFLVSLRDKLSGLPESEIEERLRFYCEMIEDRVEEGLSEEEAVLAIGSVEDVAAEIIEDVPLLTIVKERIKLKRALKVWEVVLLVLGFPVWGSLLISLFAVIFSLYACIWSAVASLWAVFASLAVSGPAFTVAGAIVAFSGNALSGIAVIGGGFVCAALAIFSFFGCVAATRGMAALTKIILKSIKRLFVKTEGVK